MFRRSKLSIQSIKDDRIKIMNDRINLTEKHLLEICATFLNYARRMAKCRDCYDDLAKGLNTCADDNSEINETFSDGIKKFANAVTLMGDFLDLKVHRVEIKLVNELAQFENVCKNVRDNLRLAMIARDKEVFKQRQMEELKSKFSANNSAADSELLKAKLEVNRTNKEIDEIIVAFEKRKLGDVKTILSNFILISIKYHTKALEVLTASYYDISNIDEKSDLREFKTVMKTKDVITSSGTVKKTNLKKNLKSSQSMDDLDNDRELLSPLKRKEGRLTRSNKNLTSRTDDEEDEEEDEEDIEEEEDDDASEEETSEHNTISGTESSGSVSEDGDNDNDRKTASRNTDERPSTSKTSRKASGREAFKATGEAQESEPESSSEINSEEQPKTKRRTFGIKGTGGIPRRPNSSTNPFEVKSAPPAKSSRTKHRLVTVVESKEISNLPSLHDAK